MKRDTDTSISTDRLDLDRLFGESRGQTRIVVLVAMAGIGLLAVGGYASFQSSFIDNTLQAPPQADIGTDASSGEVDLVVRSASNVDQLTVKKDGSPVGSASLNATVGDTATVSVTDDQIVTVVATRNPDTNQTVLEYTHSS
jgi:hypothetical protein